MPPIPPSPTSTLGTGPALEPPEPIFQGDGLDKAIVRARGLVAAKRPKPSSGSAPEPRLASRDGALELAKPASMTPRERTRLWRAANRERYNAYMREYRKRKD